MRFVLLTTLLFFTAVTRSQDPPTSSKTQIIVVTGAEGTQEFGEQFRVWAEHWSTVAKNADASMVRIGDSKNEAEESDHKRLKEAIESIDKKAARPLWLVFIGHGTYAGKAAKFNLRGPDIAAGQLSEWLKDFQRPVVIVNCASSSAPFINELSGKNRVVVTATKSGSQYNFARFGEHFAKAITSVDSDLDHDDEVSVHEAFIHASTAVKQFYAGADRIQTEHALLDDNGDAKGTPAKMFRGVRPIASAKGGESLDGVLASRISLSPTGRQLKLSDEELQKRNDLEKQLEGLRANLDQLQSDEFDQKVEPILVELARIYAAAESRESIQGSSDRNRK